jgi:hypothetical protein
MSHDVSIEGWSVRKIGVGSNKFIKAKDVGSWEAAFKMFAQWETGFKTRKFCLYGLKYVGYVDEGQTRNLVKWYPGQVGLVVPF